MLKRLAIHLLAVAIAAPALSQVELKEGRVWINGIKRDDTVWVRSCFKHANQITYHHVGDGGGHYTLGTADAWINEQISLGFDGCRVLLETDGWRRCEPQDRQNNGTPENCMFGSEPFDRGFWNVEALRRGGRPTEMHGIGRQVLRWYFEKSQETGFLFELVIIATLKHHDVDVGQQTHVVRQTLAEAYRLQQEFPQANVIMNVINEWTAHSRWTLSEVNMLAVRADRWKHPDGRTTVACSAPAGFEPEQWPCGPLIVDGGGANTFEFEVGPEPGRFDMGAVHPERDEYWWKFPNEQQRDRLVRDSRGMPWGFTESMYYVEVEDFERARGWYRMAGDRAAGWTTDWDKYLAFLRHVEDMGIPYFVVHDEKGVQSVVGWPRHQTRVDLWAARYLASGPPPEPPPRMLHYFPVIELGYQQILGRSVDPIGREIYEGWFAECAADLERDCFAPFIDALIRSDEFREKNTR